MEESMLGRFCGCLVVALLVAGSAAMAQRGVDPSAEQNVRESQQYEQLLCTNPAFRARRIAQECGPLQGSQFYESCVASFSCGAVQRGSQRIPPSERLR
jgi:hypothetical protein